MRRVAAATFSRSEVGTFLPLLRAIEAADDLELALLAGGAHLSPEHGLTVVELEDAGFRVDERIEMLDATGTAEGAAASIGLGTVGLAQALSRLRPDLLLLVGDRYELLAAVTAALPLRLPVAHVSGGDVTEGAIDNQVRYAVSALSHLHFVAMEEHAERLRRTGEEPWRIHVTGEPALDLLEAHDLMRRDELESLLELDLAAPVLVVTLHPTTLGSDRPDELLSALDRVSATVVFTGTNQDTGAMPILSAIRAFCDTHERAVLVASLGQRAYQSLLSQADAMVGNSSSGIWEAPSFRLPVVNIGDRQLGRLRAANVIDAEADALEIEGAVRQALDPAFRESLATLVNPYGDGAAASRVVSVLRSVELGQGLLRKRFGEPVVGASRPT